MSSDPKLTPAGVVEELLARSNRLGADRRNTNYGGGNTSAKAMTVDPASGDEVEVMWVKGSGWRSGDAGADRLAALRVDRLRRSARSIGGRSTKDEMHISSTTAVLGRQVRRRASTRPCTAFWEPHHVDHLHPDSVIALAAAADGEALTKQCFGDEVGWVPWRRPGFELGLNIAEMARTSPT